VRGERGLLRYQSPLRVERQAAVDRLRKFLSSSMEIAPSARTRAELSEAFLVYLPFWSIWSTVGGWVFGEKRVGSGDNKRYEPREVRFVQDLAWNGASCDVGEFGVEQIPTLDADLQPFNPDELHRRGMVFEPTGLFGEAREDAEREFEETVRRKAGLDRLSQIFVRNMRRRSALVYHPLWVLRYLFRGRAFQVVVDGSSGEILYGKAPGNTAFRAGVLTLGMAFGAFLAIDAPAFLLYISDADSNLGWVALALLAAGLGIMYAAYRKFRHGEQYEYHRGGGKSKIRDLNPIELVTSVKDVEQWIKQFS
jgi:hypothetical protein